MNTAEVRNAWINSLIGQPEEDIQQETKQLLLDLMDIVEQSRFERYVMNALDEINMYCEGEE